MNRKCLPLLSALSHGPVRKRQRKGGGSEGGQTMESGRKCRAHVCLRSGAGGRVVQAPGQADKKVSRMVLSPDLWKKWVRAY